MRLQLHNSLINIKPDDQEINHLMWRKSMTDIGPTIFAELARHTWRFSVYPVPQLSYISWLEIKRVVESGLCGRHSWSITNKVAPSFNCMTAERLKTKDVIGSAY